MTSLVTVRHNFETAHRLPFLEGKCENLHGHSWWAEWDFTGERTPEGVIIDFGQLKGILRTWVDNQFDHGAILGMGDDLWRALRRDHGSKVFVFGEDSPAESLPWPTVELVAECLYNVAEMLLPVPCTEVRVQETHVNGAVYRP